MKIDVHWHYIPDRYVSDLRAQRGNWPDKIVRGERDREFLNGEGNGQVLFPGHHQPELIREAIESRGLDYALVSSAPALFHYEMEPDRTAELAALINEGIADLCKQFPDRCLGIANVTLQDPQRAISEMERAMNDQGFKGVEIGTNVAGRNLDDPEFLPFFQRAAELNAFIFVHPVNVAGRDRMKQYYLANLIGNPTDSGIAIASMIFGGVFDRCPDLHCCFAHGGGIAPYILGRWEHGYDVRPEPGSVVSKHPSEYFKQIYCDSLAHSHAAVRYLVDLLGPDHVVLGCDYPYDMGDEDPVGSVESNPLLNDAEKHAILDENVPRLLGLATAAGS